MSFRNEVDSLPPGSMLPGNTLPGNTVRTVCEGSTYRHSGPTQRSFELGSFELGSFELARFQEKAAALREDFRIGHLRDLGHGISGPIREMIGAIREVVPLDQYRRQAHVWEAHHLVPGALSLLSFGEAKNCLYDGVRTSRFLRAIKASIASLERRIPRGPIHVIDAGCGPIPLMGLHAAAQSPRVQVLALEAHPVSARCARHCAAALGLAGRFRVESVDITGIARWDPADLIISETLTSGLDAEDFVPVMSSLARGGAIHPDTVTIPHRLELLYGILTFEEHFGNKTFARVGRAIKDDVEVFPVTSRLKCFAEWSQRRNIDRFRIPIDQAPHGTEWKERFLCITMRADLWPATESYPEIALLPGHSRITNFKRVTIPTAFNDRTVTFTYAPGALKRGKFEIE